MTRYFGKIKINVSNEFFNNNSFNFLLIGTLLFLKYMKQYRTEKNLKFYFMIKLKV